MTGLLSIGAIVLQLGIAGVLLVAYRRGDVAAVVNALVSSAIALLPPAIDVLGPRAFGWAVTLGPELWLWLAAAGLLHSIGMLGPYDSVWWWDTVTHTLSAALVAALVYAGLLVVADRPGGFDLPAWTVPALALLFTLAGGIFWELIELVSRETGRRFDIEPVLVHYGWRDTALDIVFDALGALVVVLVDLRVFVPVAEQAPRLVETLLVGSLVVVVGGSAVIAVVLALTPTAAR